MALPIQPFSLKIGPNWPNRQCYLAGSSKRVPRILSFSVAMDADNSFYVKSIATYAPAFLRHNNSVLARVLVISFCRNSGWMMNKRFTAQNGCLKWGRKYPKSSGLKWKRPHWASIVCGPRNCLTCPGCFKNYFLSSLFSLYIN